MSTSDQQHPRDASFARGGRAGQGVSGRRNETTQRVFDACEQLLAEKSLEAISVTELVSLAGVSRATFYIYFGSKFEVVAGLLRDVMGEIYQIVQPFLESADDEAPGAALRRSLGEAWMVWAEHRLLMRAMAEHWHAVPELGGIWMEIVGQFVDAMAAEIDRRRELGTVPPGLDSRQLAAMLIWSTERCMHVAGLGVDDVLTSEEAIFEPLVGLWLRALYATEF